MITGMFTPSNRETRLNVFIDGRMETLYASQLSPPTSRPAPSGNRSELNARLTALQLAAPSLANLYSLQAGRIDFIPYSSGRSLSSSAPIARACWSLMRSASEKTIEAGILLRELQARRPLRSVLVVCSKTLVVEEKWHREMRRFDEEFVRSSATSCATVSTRPTWTGEWPERYARAILPFSLVNENLLNGYPSRNGGRAKGLRRSTRRHVSIC